MSCIICKCETTKYKCPKCFEFYCSVECCQKHKETECSPPPPINTNENGETDEPPINLPFTTEDTVSSGFLEKLERSDHLKNLLQNQHLRNFIKEIDRAPNAWDAMRAAMQEPLFIEFADECLKLVQPNPDDI